MDLSRRKNLIVTKGAKGCWYNGKDFKLSKPSEVRDVSGAGDTFLAGLLTRTLLLKMLNVQ